MQLDALGAQVTWVDCAKDLRPWLAVLATQLARFIKSLDAIADYELWFVALAPSTRG